jgi:hypothetical protein
VNIAKWPHPTVCVKLQELVVVYSEQERPGTTASGAKRPPRSRGFLAGFSELGGGPQGVWERSSAWSGLSGATLYDLKPCLAETFVEAGKDVAAVAFGADFVFPAFDQNVSLEQVIDASNDHGDTGRPLTSPSSQSKETSTGIKVSVTHNMIYSQAAIKHGHGHRAFP